MLDREERKTEPQKLSGAAMRMPSLALNARAIADLELIANGAFSPLEGFMGEEDYTSVRDNMRLANGLVWTIPVTLSATAEELTYLRAGNDIALCTSDGRLLAVLHLAEIFS